MNISPTEKSTTASGAAAPITVAPPLVLGQSTLDQNLNSLLVVAGVTALVLGLSVAFILSGFGRPLIIVGSVAAVVAPTVYGRVDLAAAVVVVAAMLSPLITVICHSPLGAWVDNVALAALAGVCLVLGLIGRRFSLLGCFALVAFVIGIAALRAPTHSVGLYQARQVLVPISLIFSGIVVAENAVSLNSLRMAVLVTGVINLMYMAVEAGLGPIIPPHAAYEFKEFSRVRKRIEGSAGLPGNYYFFYSSGHAKLVRLGGLLFQPPVTGIFTGLLAIVSYWTIRRRAIALAVAALALIATLATFSRAGVLLVVLGIGLPVLVARVGKKAGIGIIVVLLALATPVILHEGASARHLEGFTTSLSIALHHPLGLGFGHFGNSAKVSANSVAGESLLGVLIAGTGLIGLLLILGAIASLLRATDRVGWIAWTGIAALVIAGLSESAGGLAGTAALWLFAGLALGIGVRAAIPDQPRTGVAGGEPTPSDGAGTMTNRDTIY